MREKREGRTTPALKDMVEALVENSLADTATRHFGCSFADASLKMKVLGDAVTAYANVRNASVKRIIKGKSITM